MKKQKSKSGYESEVTAYECEDCIGWPYKERCTKAKGNKRLCISKGFLEKRQESYENILSEKGIQYRMDRSIQVEGTSPSSDLMMERLPLLLYRFHRISLHKNRGKKNLPVGKLVFVFDAFDKEFSNPGSDDAWIHINVAGLDIEEIPVQDISVTDKRDILRNPDAVGAEIAQSSHSQFVVHGENGGRREIQGEEMLSPFVPGVGAVVITVELVRVMVVHGNSDRLHRTAEAFDTLNTGTDGLLAANNADPAVAFFNQVLCHLIGSCGIVAVRKVAFERREIDFSSAEDNGNLLADGGDKFVVKSGPDYSFFDSGLPAHGCGRCPLYEDILLAPAEGADKSNYCKRYGGLHSPQRGRQADLGGGQFLCR